MVFIIDGGRVMKPEISQAKTKLYIVAFRILYTSGRFEIIIFKNAKTPRIHPFHRSSPNQASRCPLPDRKALVPLLQVRRNAPIKKSTLLGDLAKIKSAENHLPSPLLQATLLVMKAKNRWLLVLINRA